MIYDGFYTSKRWLFGISSINSSFWVLKLNDVECNVQFWEGPSGVQNMYPWDLVFNQGCSGMIIYCSIDELCSLDLKRYSLLEGKWDPGNFREI